MARFGNGVIQGVFPRGVTAAARPAPGRCVDLKCAQAKFPHPRHDSPIQRHAAAGSSAFALPDHLASFAESGGSPLPPTIRQKMESFYGANFSDVRVHVGPQASAIGALAFTQGSHIHFAPGQYNPSSPQGQQVLGHELAHVLQQRSGRVRNPFGSGVAVVQDRHLEAEADRLGASAASHRPASAQPKMAGHVPHQHAAGVPRTACAQCFPAGQRRR
jgi:hypothetical protein